MSVFRALAVLVVVGTSGVSVSAQCTSPPACANSVPEQVGPGLSMRLPWKAPFSHTVTQGYCYVNCTTCQLSGGDHSGYEVDFYMDPGTEVVAIASGTVIQTGDYSLNCYSDILSCLTSCAAQIDSTCPAGSGVRNGSAGITAGGTFIKIQHVVHDATGYRYYNSAYLHLQAGSRRFNRGQHVNQGEVIGLSGNTGCSSGPHLHLHVRRGTYVSNPTACPAPSETCVRQVGMPAVTCGVRPVPMVGKRTGTTETVITDFVPCQSYTAIEPGVPGWTPINLHPTGATGSAALGVRGGQQVGTATVSGQDHASLWNGSPTSWTDLHPGAGYRRSQALAVDNGQQVGTAQAILNGTTQPPQAFLWNGSAPGMNLRPSGSAISSHAYGIRAGKQVGTFQLSGGNRAALWSGSAGSVVDLTPASATDASILKTNGSQHFGFVSGVPTVWTGGAPTPLNLPSDAIVRDADVDSGVQVGSRALFFNPPSAIQIRAFLWHGTAASGVDLHPAGADVPGQNANGYGSEAWGTGAGRQVGYALFGGVAHAGIWSGTAASWTDLHAVLHSTFPAFTDSWATAVSVDGGTTYVVGYGSNSVTGRTEALMWSGVNVGGPGDEGTYCPADFDTSGSVNTQDIFAFINAWFAGSGAADVNADDTLGIEDIFDFLNIWFAGC